MEKHPRRCHAVATLEKGKLRYSITQDFMTHVPYKGSGPAMTDLVGGHVSLMAETAPAALPFIIKADD